MTDAERQRRRRDRLKSDVDEAADVEAKAARIADEILEFIGIGLVMDVLEGCLAGHDDDDDDTDAPYYDFETGIPGEPRLYRLLKELDALIDWEAEDPEEAALVEFLGEREGIRMEREEARAKAARNPRTRA